MRPLTALVSLTLLGGILAAPAVSADFHPDCDTADLTRGDLRCIRNWHPPDPGGGGGGGGGDPGPFYLNPLCYDPFVAEPCPTMPETSIP